MAQTKKSAQIWFDRSFEALQYALEKGDADTAFDMARNLVRNAVVIDPTLRSVAAQAAKCGHVVANLYKIGYCSYCKKLSRGRR